MLYKCEAILYRIVSESINSLGSQNQDFRVTSSFELIKTLSNSNFSRQVSRVYLSIHVAIFTLLASLPGWEPTNQSAPTLCVHPSPLQRAPAMLPADSYTQGSISALWGVEQGN